MYQLIVEPAGFTDYRTNPAGDWTPAGTGNALAMAVRVSTDGDTIGFTGYHKALKFNWSNSENKDDINKGTQGLTVIGLDHTAALGGLSFHNPTPDVNGNMAFQNFEMRCNSQRPVIFNANSQGTFGLMTFKRIHFRGDPNVVKWYVHAPVQATWEFIKCRFPDGCIEHAGYLFAPVTDPEFPDEPALLVSECYVALTGRTAWQVVTRESSGLKGNGLLRFERSEAVDCGARDGGSAFTVAGHYGPVEFEDLRIYSDHAAANITAPDRGAIVCYKDGKMGGDGFGVGPVTIRRVQANYESPDRNLVALSSCESVDIVQPLFQSGNGKGLHLEHNGQANGPVRMHGRTPPSTWKGWQSGPVKRNGAKLSNDELDALWAEA